MKTSTLQLCNEIKVYFTIFVDTDAWVQDADENNIKIYIHVDMYASLLATGMLQNNTYSYLISARTPSQ